jgi:hypothetical protein
MLLSAAAAGMAQKPSLAALPKGERFDSAEFGLSVALPKVPTEIVKDGTDTEFRWDLTEGRFTIMFGNYLPPTLSFSEDTRQSFLKGYKEDLLTHSHLKYVSESPAAIGDYRGTTYSLEIPSQKLRLRDTEATVGRHFVSIVAGFYTDIPGAEDRILAALRSIVILRK